jgi:hypothetical protein
VRGGKGARFKQGAGRALPRSLKVSVPLANGLEQARHAGPGNLGAPEKSTGSAKRLSRAGSQRF